MVVPLPQDPALLLPECGTAQESDDPQLLGSMQIAYASKEAAEERAPLPEAEAGESSRGSGKRKRGHASRGVNLKTPSKKKVEEDVCFICFDGGNLVLCDRRGCPKAYHPECVNLDEASVQGKTPWNCDWHICSICEKPSHYMCYTCTYSLCNGCIKEAGLLCVRGKQGFCETCMKTVMLIERGVRGNKEMAKVDFNDKSNWEYLFKEYWLDLKGKLSLTLEELTKAKNPFNEGPSREPFDANDDLGYSSDSSTGLVQASSKGKRVERRSRTSAGKGGPCTTKAVGTEGPSVTMGTEWASKELLEFVAHVKDGDTSPLSLKDVRVLLLEYIKINNLRDLHKKRQITCDLVLGNLFGKERIEHFEMLRVLRQHFLAKGTKVCAGRGLGGSIGADATQMETEGPRDSLNLKRMASDKRRKSCKRTDERWRQTNLDDFAAIDVYNINLIYLRRKLLDDMLADNDMDKFEDKVVGSFVRIRVSGTVQNQDIYRLVQVVGTGKTEEAYKSGRKTEDVTLEILNLSSIEVISIGTVSNQEFTEEECRDLRQSIKCGLINPLKVGEVQEKARALQKVRMKDWLEAEMKRLSNLRDRASEKGRRKELNECLKKLQLLSKPEERSRLLEEIPMVHDDPYMDPTCASDEDEGNLDDSYKRQKNSRYSRKGKEPISPGKGGSASNNWKSGMSAKDDSLDVGAKDSSWNPGSSSWETASGLESSGWNSELARSGESSNASQDIALAPISTTFSSDVNETEKIWHYEDPSGKIQGPFSVTQLRKWSNIGYFPSNLSIWRTSEKQEDCIQLTDALAGIFKKEPPQWETQASGFSLLQSDTTAFDSRENDHGGGWNGSTLRDKQKSDGDWESNWNNASGPKNGNAEASKTDAWGTQTTAWTSKTSEVVSSKEGWTGGSSSGAWKPSKPLVNTDKWPSGQNDGNSWNTSTNSFDSSNQGLEKPNNSKGWETPSAVVPKSTTDAWDAKQESGNHLSNLPTTTKQSSEWPAGQSAENKWSAASVQPASSGWGPISNSGSEEAQEFRGVATDSDNIAAGWGTQVCTSEKPAVGGWEVLNRPPLAACNPDEQNTGVKASSGGWGSDALDPMSKANETTNICDSPHIVPSNHFMPHSVSTPESLEPTISAMPINVQLASDDLGSDPSAATMELAEPFQCNLHNSANDQAWGTRAATDDPDTRCGMTSKNSNEGWDTAKVKSSNMGFGTPSEGESDGCWGTVTKGNAEGGWGVASQGKTGTSWEKTAAQGNTDAGWGTVTKGNAEADWGAAAQGKTNTSWEKTAALGNKEADWGTVTKGNAEVDWGVATQGKTNTSWEKTTGQGNTDSGWGTVTKGNAEVGWGVEKTAVQGKTDAGWGASLGSTNAVWGAPQASTSPGWGTTSQGNAKAGWEAPSWNSNGWDDQQKSTGERFSGDKDRGFRTRDSLQSGGKSSWNRSFSGDRDGDSAQGGGKPSWNRSMSTGDGGSSRPPPKGQRVCKFHASGHCKKGASCDYLHT